MRSAVFVEKDMMKRRMPVVVLLAVIVSTLMQREFPSTPLPQTNDLTRVLGEQVLTTYVLPFELLALLMLAAMLGAIYFARPED